MQYAWENKAENMRQQVYEKWNFWSVITGWSQENKIIKGLNILMFISNVSVSLKKVLNLFYFYAHCIMV